MTQVSMLPPQPRYAYEYGRRWDKRVPRYDVNWLMGRVHVSLSDTQVEADIRRRCRNVDGMTEALIKATVRYALIVHHRNQDLYHRVMTGRL